MMEICAGLHGDSTAQSQIQPIQIMGLLVFSFNGKPQATVPRFACACGSPLNEFPDSVNRNDSLQAGPGQLKIWNCGSLGILLFFCQV